MRKPTFSKSEKAAIRTIVNQVRQKREEATRKEPLPGNEVANLNQADSGEGVPSL